jgi:hypothetical protein
MKMNAMIQQLMDKTGLPEDKATAAVSTVVDFLKEKLPSPIASQIDSLMGGGASGLTEKLGGVMQSVGGMFGKK